MEFPTLRAFQSFREKQEFTPREKEEILNRSISVALVALKGEGLEEALLEEFANKFAAKSHLTPEERAFFSNPKPLPSDLSKFSWRYESLFVLAWSLGFVEKLPIPREANNPGPIIALFKKMNREELLEKARLRTPEEILDQADLAYRYHWALEEIRANPKATPTNLNQDVVMEWHHAFNWLIRYMDDEWDNIATDT